MAQFYLVHQDAGVAQSIKDSLASTGEHKLVGHSSSGAEALAKIGEAGAKILLLQLALPDANGLSLLGQFNTKVPNIYIVPILEGNEPGDIWQKILQLGLRDVITPPVNPKSVIGVLEQAAVHAESFVGTGGGDAASSYMVTVASARGGVGKSIFSTNLAISLAQLGAATTLVDYSMSPGDFFTMLDQVPRNSIADAISQGMGLDQTLLSNLVADHPLGFKFLACPNDDFDFYGFDYDQGIHLLRESRTLSEFILVDTGAYDLPPTQAAVDEADLVFLLTTRDLSRLMGLQRLIKSFTARDIPEEKLKVIVNNAEVGTEITEQEIEDVLAHPVTAYLPSCPAETVFSINSGKPMAQSKADHPLSAVINKLGEYTAVRWQDA